MPAFRHDGALHWFAQVPRCAGSAVTAHLAARFGPLAFHEPGRHGAERWTRTLPQVVTWSDLGHLVPEGWFASCFAVVRHPLDRIVSVYNDQAARQHRVARGVAIDDWFEQKLRAFRDDPYLLENHLRPQSAFVPEGAVCFRLEDGLEALGAWLDAHFGPAPDAPPLRQIRHELPRAAGFAPSAEVPNRLIRRVREVHGEDYERFGYPMRPAAPPRLLAPAEAGPGRARLLRVTGSLRDRARGLAARYTRPRR